MKTIKQIADELGVSKQKVYRFIVRNHITASSEVKQSKLYDEATEMLIKQGILEDEPYQKSHHEAHQNHINDTVSEAVIELLRKEMEQKNEQLQEKDRQIREKDQQISEMQAQLSMNQKLMDQEQQLHMIMERKYVLADCQPEDDVSCKRCSPLNFTPLSVRAMIVPDVTEDAFDLVAHDV